MNAVDKPFANSPGISGDELRELIKKPASPGDWDRFVEATVGLFSPSEVDALEQRINEMCERVEGEHEDKAWTPAS